MSKLSKPQEFHVTLRVFTDPAELTTFPRKPVTEARIRQILKNALDPEKMDAIIETVRFGDVIDVTR